MKRMLINATHTDEIRVAIVDGARLIDLDIERPDLIQNKANIYKGKISSIEPSLGAVFVDYDQGRHGFLPLKEISPEYFLIDVAADQPIDIRSVLKVGQELVVQVEKEERGTKGAALTTFISLAGSFLVLMPNNPKAGGISRRIDGEEREELRETFTELDVPDGMGIIIRTAGVGRSKEDLTWDLQILLRYWEAIKQAAIARPGPYLIHQESDVVIRAIRDYLRQDIQEVIIDNLQAYNRAKNYINLVRPDFIERLKLYSDPLPLFSRFHIEQQIESAHQREVQLPSGGSLVIDHTEALVAIDINSARATKGGSIEETAYNTNLEAANEIARQLRLRDIGGLIVIDYIDMIPTAHQREVENCLRNALKQDRARIQIGRISRFGLLEMSRQRLRSSLRKSTRITCPRCEGQGAIRSVESIATSMLHLMEEQCIKGENIQLQVQLPIDVATYLLNEKRASISKIEQQTHSEIFIIPNEQLESPQYFLKHGRVEINKQASSYKMQKNQKEVVSPKKTQVTKASEPSITDFLTTTLQDQPPRRKTVGDGVIKRLWNAMFGVEKENKPSTSVTSTNPLTPVREKSSPTGNLSRKKGFQKSSPKPGVGSSNGRRPPRNFSKGRTSSDDSQGFRKNYSNDKFRKNAIPSNANVANKQSSNKESPIEVVAEPKEKITDLNKTISESSMLNDQQYSHTEKTLKEVKVSETQLKEPPVAKPEVKLEKIVDFNRQETSSQEKNHHNQGSAAPEQYQAKGFQYEKESKEPKLQQITTKTSEETDNNN